MSNSGVSRQLRGVSLNVVVHLGRSESRQQFPSEKLKEGTHSVRDDDDDDDDEGFFTFGHFFRSNALTQQAHKRATDYGIIGSSRSVAGVGGRGGGRGYEWNCRGTVGGATAVGGNQSSTKQVCHKCVQC